MKMKSASCPERNTPLANEAGIRDNKADVKVALNHNPLPARVMQVTQETRKTIGKNPKNNSAEVADAEAPRKRITIQIVVGRAKEIPRRSTRPRDGEGRRLVFIQQSGKGLE
jgi:hypothetical protein